MSTELNRNADLHIADLLSEEIARAPAAELLNEVAEDFGKAGKLAKEFDRSLARAKRRAWWQRIAARLRELASPTLTLLSFRPAGAMAAVALIAVLAGGGLYTLDRWWPTGSRAAYDAAIRAAERPKEVALVIGAERLEADRAVLAMELRHITCGAAGCNGAVESYGKAIEDYEKAMALTTEVQQRMQIVKQRDAAGNTLWLFIAPQPPEQVAASKDATDQVETDRKAIERAIESHERMQLAKRRDEAGNTSWILAAPVIPAQTPNSAG